MKTCLSVVSHYDTDLTQMLLIRLKIMTHIKFNIKKCKNKIENIYVLKSASSSPVALEELTSDRYLSGILNNKLSFNEHIEHPTKSHNLQNFMPQKSRNM